MNSKSKLLGSNIQYYRQKAKLSQHELADKVNVTRNYLSLIENGKKLPSFKLIIKLAQELDVTPSALFGGDPLLKELKQLSEEFGLEKLIEGLKQLTSIHDGD